MYYTGFADEAGNSIETQIKATRELGWNHIESRNIDSINITDISDESFDMVFQKLSEANIKISCFGSAVANWATDPRDENDFLQSLNSLKRAIPRMQKLGTKYLRGMSFGIVRDEEPDNPEIEKLIFRKVNVFVNLCEEAGLFYLHENCMNYGGLSYQHTLKLLEAVKSPAFGLVFDTGNPVGSDFRVGTPPYQKQSSWDFYKNVREFIKYIHIKDCVFIKETGQIFPELHHTFPGEGHGDVRKIIKDLLANGYDDGFSIEPHLAVLYHNHTITSSEKARYNNYINYGKCLMNIVEEIQSSEN